MNINTLLEEEIVNEFNKLNDMEKGTDEYRTTVDGLTKLMDRAIEMEKFDTERKDQKEAQRIETELKLAQMKDDKIDKIVRNGITLGLGLLSAGCAVWGTLKTFKFEQEGTVTTIFGRGWFNKLQKLK